MSTVDVRYNLHVEFGEEIASNHSCLLPPWAMNDGEETAKAVAVEHMIDLWDEHADDDGCDVVVDILSPDEIKGTYRVELRKRIVAGGVLTLDSEAAR